MNAADDPTQDELAARLDHLATTIDLRAGSLDAVRQRADQRTRRRRTTVGGLSVMAVVTASITGVVVLSRPTDPTVSNRAADHGAPTASDVLDPTTSPESTGGAPRDPAVDPVATDLAIGPPMSTIAGTGVGATSDTVAATPWLDLVDSDLTWTSVRPDSTRALAYPYLFPMSAARSMAAAASPVYMYSSAPGRVPDGVGSPPTLYRSDDGISWTAVDPGELPDHTALVGQLAGQPDSLYALSTAPSSAMAEQPAADQPVTVDTSGIETGSGAEVVLSTRSTDGGWTSSVVPLDSASWLDVPGVVRAMPTNLSASSVDHHGAGSIVVIGSTYLQLDVSAIGADPNDDSVQITPSGVELMRYDRDCFPTATTVVMGADTTTASTTEPAGGNTTTTGPAGTCGEPAWEHHDLSELGVDQRALDEYFAPPHLFVSTADGSFTETAFPGSVPADHIVSAPRLLALGAQHALVYDEIARDDYSTIATRLWLSSDGTDWREVALPSAVQGSSTGLTLGVLADGRIAGAGTEATAPWHPLAFVEDGAGGWRVTDLAGALRPEDGVSASLGLGSVVIGDTGITVAGTVMTDPLVENGPVSTTEGDLTFTLLDSHGTIVITITETGEEVARLDPATADSAHVRYEESGDTVLIDPDTGDEIARIPWRAQQRLNDQAYGDRILPGVLLHSPDGVSWSRESLQELGSPTATWVNGLLSVDGKVLATYLNRAVLNDDGTPATFVLVGTPNG